MLLDIPAFIGIRLGSLTLALGVEIPDVEIPDIEFRVAISPLLSNTSNPFNFWLSTFSGWNFFARPICARNQSLTSSCCTSSISLCTSSKCRFSWSSVSISSLQIGQARRSEAATAAAKGWEEDPSC